MSPPPSFASGETESQRTSVSPLKSQGIRDMTAPGGQAPQQATP